jgi:hypothetical protein
VLNGPRDRQGTDLSVGQAVPVRDDQATVRPPFDPAEFARQSEMSTVPPPAHVPELPDQDPEVTSSSSETTLEVLFVDGDTIATLAVAREDLDWFDLSPTIRDLLRHVDGEALLSQVCARASQPLEESITLVEQLVRDGVVSCR